MVFNEADILLYSVIALSMLVLYVMYSQSERDAQKARQIRSIASAIEQVQRDLYELKKEINFLDIELRNPKKKQLNEDELLVFIDTTINEKALPISHTLNQIEEVFEDFRKSYDRRLIKVEDGIKSVTIPSSITGMDDEKIVMLYKNGNDVSTISKELNLSSAEVQFVLKINKLI